MSDEDLFKAQAEVLVKQIYGLPGLPPSSIENAFFAINNALYSAFCEGVASKLDDRNAIIEECAKVAEAEDSFLMLQDFGLQSSMIQKAHNIATVIRALKSTSPTGTPSKSSETSPPSKT